MNLKGKIVEVLNLENNGKTLFLLSVVGHQDLPYQKDGNILCKAYSTMLSEAATVEVTGEFCNDIFDVTKIELTFINQQSLADYILTCCKGSRIGKVFVNKVVSKYKKEILTMGGAALENAILKDFPSIKPIKAKLIVDALYYKHNDILEELEQLFESSCIEKEQLIDIYSKYGESSIRQLKNNPYNIGLEFRIKYTAIDFVAKKFHIDTFDFKRIEGLIHYALEEAASKGHTWMKANYLAKRVSAMSMKSAYMTKIYPIMVSNTVILSKRFVLDEYKISLKKYYIAEVLIAQKLNQFKKNDSYIQVTKDDINTISDELNFNFGKEQRESFRLLESDGVSVLTGGPGTGKTTTVKGIVKLYLKKNPGKKVAFCAPTGRAAKQLSIATTYNAKTIHKMLEYKPFENGLCIKKTQADPIEADFIIIDEFSMVDVELMAMLLEAVKLGTRLLLVGDENQLPSIGAGNLLHDIIESKKFPVYRLTENFRQKGNGSIIDNANLILDGITPKQSENFKIFKAKNEEDAFNGLCYFIKMLYNIKDPFLTQLIEPSRKGFAGTYKMNQYIHKELIHNGKEDISPSPMVNDKIIFKQTNYDVGYVNGDIGIIKALTANEVVIWNDFEELVLPLSALNDLELAYSYTIHKSQGSENENVIIYLPEEMKHMMTRSLFYTAVTRAKKNVIVIYTGNALELCLSNISDKKRNTRLQEFL